eukprot:802480-Amorphochlora_amoeboformis.AAC.1
MEGQICMALVPHGYYCPKLTVLQEGLMWVVWVVWVDYVKWRNVRSCHLILGSPVTTSTTG